MSTRVKICGLTREVDARAAASLGADLIGINFWTESKRFCEPTQASAVAAAARDVMPTISVVGVFVNPTDAEITAADACQLDWIQLHGDETGERVAGLGERAFKATAVRSPDDVVHALEFPGSMLLLDAPSAGYGGSGETFDWQHCAALRDSRRQWLLAGGLDPDNVASAIALAKPWGVDVASGIESRPGVKDVESMRRFIAAAKGNP